MTLILLAAFPVLAASSYIQAQQMAGTSGNKQNNDADTAAGSLLSEAIGSIRTVASFSMEVALNTLYVGYLGVSKEADVKIGIVGGLAFGVSQGAMFLVLAVLFYISGRWISRGIITFEEFFMVLMVIMLSTFAIGMAAQGATDGAKAKRSAQRVFKVIDRKPLIDATSGTGRTLDHVDGDIEFRNLAFMYPARPDAKIYKNYSLKIARGQTVALVGASGSGKSTAISLMERFYDPAAGIVTLDGNNLKELNLQWLRENVSLVSQEPVLFAGTIAENIELGKPGSSREEIIEAAKKANAFDFISNFPNGFDTDVGDRGAQVSGGQKQRIAIARAILRDPAVLLLDEATSALDNESERVVQASLDRLLALKQRTTIIVSIGTQLASLRSRLVKDTCECLLRIVKVMERDFQDMANALLPQVIGTAKSALAAIRQPGSKLMCKMSEVVRSERVDELVDIPSSQSKALLVSEHRDSPLAEAILKEYPELSNTLSRSRSSFTQSRTSSRKSPRHQREQNIEIHVSKTPPPKRREQQEVTIPETNSVEATTSTNDECLSTKTKRIRPANLRSRAVIARVTNVRRVCSTKKVETPVSIVCKSSEDQKTPPLHEPLYAGYTDEADDIGHLTEGSGHIESDTEWNHRRLDYSGHAGSEEEEDQQKTSFVAKSDTFPDEWHLDDGPDTNLSLKMKLAVA
ncbi:P-loop containing nucleoside triphosphate hydrolase [Phytophthora cactorum]|nr:P-loop containing nucleoside triphosphate hydrolase [Phytophthora cactorum]